MRRFLIFAATVACLAGGATVVAPAASATVLDVTLEGTGTGTVTSAPAGISCSNVPGSTQATCSHDFEFYFGTNTITAVPGEGSAFLSWSGNLGGTCSGGTNPCVTGFMFFGAAPMSAIATFAPKPEAPTVTTGAATGVSFPSATVGGSVNPDNDDFAVLDCYFEYGLTTDYGEKVSCRPGAIGTGTSPVAVSASIGPLEPGETYHYRLVSSNGGGIRQGQDETFVSASAPPDECSNASVRAQQGVLAQRLPNCGAYELVSPAFTAGQTATAAVGTADGNNVMLYSPGGFAGVENLPDSGIQYTTQRTAEGWKTSSIAPPASKFPFIGGASALDWTRDGSRSLWFVNLRVDEGTKRFTPIVRDPDGSFHVAGPTQDDVGGGFPVNPVATSEDLSTVLQATFTRVPLTDGTTDSRSPSTKSLYVSSRGADDQIETRQVAYGGGSSMFPGCDVMPGGASPLFNSNITARNTVSADGERIFFTAVCVTPEPEAQRVWAKVGDDDPIDLSASTCPAVCGDEQTAAFRGASRNGSRVYFTTTQRLLPADEDTSAQSDLYEYDFEASGQKLRMVTGSSDPDGADVRSVLRISNDGAFVYFLATGRALAGQNSRGAAPEPGENNLYVYHRPTGQSTGTTTFIGALGSSTFDADPPVSTSGRFILLQTTADLTGDRLPGDGHADLYRYDSQDDELLRVWTDDPAHNGTLRVGAAYADHTPEQADNAPGGGMQQSAAWNARLQMSDDGSLVGFTTTEPLSRDDHNARTDAYLWQADDGRLTMLTDGTSKPGNQFNGSQFLGMTPSGDSLFVMSGSPLLKAHTNGQNAMYVARRNGGFPELPAPTDPCVADGCQGPAPTPPGVPGPGGSSVFIGPGNPLPSPPRSPATIRVAKAAAVRGAVARVSVRVSEGGRLQVSGASLVRTSLAVTKAGTVRVSVKLSKRGQRSLQRSGRLKTRASIRYAPTVGKPVVARVTVTFTAKSKKRKAKASLRSASPQSDVLSVGVQKGR